MGTTGWFAFAAGSVGVTADQTVRLNVVNLSSSDVKVLFGIWENPTPVLLAEDSHTLTPGAAHNSDVNASELAKKIFDSGGRVQVRAFVRCSSRAVGGTLEVFDNKTGRTSSILPLQEVPRE
jgi:hypothetical protein